MLEIGVNSFLSLEEANEIVENEFISQSKEKEIWSSLIELDKEKILKKGTMVLNTLNFIGVREVISSNTLKFPRYINGVSCIPYEIKLATVIQGIYSYSNSIDEYTKMSERGISSIAVGPNRINFKDSSKVNPISNDVVMLIKRYILTSVRG